MSELTPEEQANYEELEQLYRELSNTKISDYLISLREKIISRIARVDDEKLLWKETGKLWIIDNLINKKQSTYNEIKRMDAVVNG